MLFGGEATIYLDLLYRIIIMNYGDIQGWFNFDDIYDEAVKKAKNGSVFVEIGSWKGRSSAYMAQKIKESGKDIKFFAIDTFEGAPDNYQQNKLLREMDQSLYFTFVDNMIKCNLTKYVFPIKLDSVAASILFEDKSVDFVFIDGDHNYQAIKQDLEVWHRKIKKGGILAGHDYLWECNDKTKAVYRAVNEFIVEYDYGIEIKKDSWFINVD